MNTAFGEPQGFWHRKGLTEVCESKRKGLERDTQAMSSEKCPRKKFLEFWNS